MTQSTLTDELLDAQTRGITLAPPSSRASLTLAEACDIQEGITRRRLASGWRMVGRKIGFTNRNIWPAYGVEAPMWAPIFNQTITQAPLGVAHISLAGTVQPRIEPEILFGLAAPLPAGVQDLEKILAHVAWYAHAIEIVQSHYPGWKATAADYCADNVCHAFFVVGPPRSINRQHASRLITALSDCTVELRKNGETQQIGRGTHVLGHPLLALAHLATLVAERPNAAPLRAGELVSTGTLTDALPIAAGERWSTRFAGIDIQDLQLHFSH
jgi:2-keto-4-pentenoate hydratase